MLKALICEDQLENALCLKDILERIEGVEVLGHAEDGMSAVAMAKSLSPDVVFMDIGLPGMDGLSAIEVIKGIAPDIFTVITTAYPEYALDAYRLYVYDYIVKPYDSTRVIRTVTNIMKIIEDRTRGIRIPTNKRVGRIVIKTRDEIIFLNQHEIVMVERDEAKSCIHTVKEVFETYDSLSSLEERLDRDMFFRSHRGYLVNMHYVDRIVSYGRKVYAIKFKNIKKEALISYSRINDLEALIS
ncbi:MAG: response regulator transcription factor [Clostridiales bacterium]|jgi:two-component system LytT family response regulator|nr:response regulator transcription factor [Clostridiales bacterium]